MIHSLPRITTWGHSWCDLPMIFTRDFVTRENNWQNRLTRDPKIVIHGNSCIILYIIRLDIFANFQLWFRLNWHWPQGMGEPLHLDVFHWKPRFVTVPTKSLQGAPQVIAKTTSRAICDAKVGIITTRGFQCYSSMPNSYVAWLNLCCQKRPQFPCSMKLFRVDPYDM